MQNPACRIVSITPIFITIFKDRAAAAVLILDIGALWVAVMMVVSVV